jgi:chromosome segregation ATPase
MRSFDQLQLLQRQWQASLEQLNAWSTCQQEHDASGAAQRRLVGDAVHEHITLRTGPIAAITERLRHDVSMAPYADMIDRLRREIQSTQEALAAVTRSMSEVRNAFDNANAIARQMREHMQSTSAGMRMRKAPPVTDLPAPLAAGARET